MSNVRKTPHGGGLAIHAGPKRVTREATHGGTIWGSGRVEALGGPARGSGEAGCGGAPAAGRRGGPDVRRAKRTGLKKCGLDKGSHAEAYAVGENARR